jgi:hypothetical protein
VHHILLLLNTRANSYSVITLLAAEEVVVALLEEADLAAIHATALERSVYVFPLPGYAL